jgi:hypothetical protein
MIFRTLTVHRGGEKSCLLLIKQVLNNFRKSSDVVLNFKIFPFPVCDRSSFDSEIETDTDLVLILYRPRGEWGGGVGPARC